MLFISVITVFGIAFESMAMQQRPQQPEWNIQDKDGDTAVHYIARFCDKRDSQFYTDIIIESNGRIDTSIKNNGGKTAEQIAYEKYLATGKRRCQDIFLSSCWATNWFC